MPWLPDLPFADLVRIEIVRVTLGGEPSGVTSALLRLHLADGRVVVREIATDGEVYESLVAVVARANAALGAPVSEPDR